MKVEAAFVVAKVNPRREKAGEDSGPLACDVKLTNTLGSKAVRDLFQTEGSASLFLEKMWSELGELVTTDISKIELSGEIKQGEAKITTEFDSAGMIFREAKLNKIKLIPKPNRVVEVECRLQVYTNPNECGRLCEMTGTEIVMKCESVQGDLDLPKAPKPVNQQKVGEAGTNGKVTRMALQ